MRRVRKCKNSKILLNKWVYKKGDAPNNKAIREVLETEQQGFCAYTEERLSSTYARDVEHFNPNLKNTAKDNYKNWFAVSHKWNNEKGKKWDNFQPLMHPTALNFESRLWYEEGVYLTKNNDKKAKNLRDYLCLNDEQLAQERKNYIKGLKDIQNFCDLKTYLKNNPDFIRFPRALETEFGIKLKNILTKK